MVLIEHAEVNCTGYGCSFTFPGKPKLSKLPIFEVHPTEMVGWVGVVSESVRLEDGSLGAHNVIFCPDRKMILDPQSAEPQPLERYELLDWMPLIKMLPYDGPEL